MRYNYHLTVRYEGNTTMTCLVRTAKDAVAKLRQALKDQQTLSATYVRTART